MMLLAGVLLAAGGCVSPDTSRPDCRADQRLAIVAQAVDTAAYVPCVGGLPDGWTFTSFHVDDTGASFTLQSDRADDPVRVALRAACDIGEATPVVPRNEGVRTYLEVDALAPAYAGRLYDVFPGGCVVSEFAFPRGPHIALTDELQQAVTLYARRELRQQLREELGITLE